MMALFAAPQACLAFDFGTGIDILFSIVVFAIPVAAVPLIARTARRHPSAALVREGRRRGGVQVFRVGLVLSGLSVAAMVTAFFIPASAANTCEPVAGYLTLAGVIVLFVGALMVGSGWAFAIRAGWVVLATIAVLDLLILYINVLVWIYGENSGGLLLLAFAIHGICTLVAARWSFNAKDLGPIERAKAGEAGRTLGAVWVFLASYTALNVIRVENGIFDTAAGSAVTGALTLGALAVTMGSGFTKYSEAIHAKPPSQ